LSAVRLVCVTAALAVVASLGAARGAAATDPRPAVGAMLPSALLWGDELFFDRIAFERWLRRHDESYRRWAALHPAGRLILRQAAAKPPRFLRSQYAPTRSAPPRDTVPLAAAPARTGSATSWLLVAFALIGGMLLAVSAVPTRHLVPHFAPAARLHGRRAGVSATGIAILLGIAIAKLSG
jgi:hypothetical protein